MRMLWIIVLGLLAWSALINIRKFGWKVYVLRILLSLDQLLNTLWGGYPDETISSRCERGRLRGYWYWCWLAKFLNWLDPNHTMEALRSEKERAHLGF